MEGGKVRGKSKLLFFLVFVSFLLFLPSLNALTTESTLLDIQTIMVFGSGTKTAMENRISGAYELVKEANTQKVILSGGCVPPESGQDIQKRTCPVCGKGCTEAGEMRKILLQKTNTDKAVYSGPSDNPSEIFLLGKAFKLIIEDKSTSTNDNYKNTLSQFGAGEKVLLVSDSSHIAAVAYCLRYANNVDAYYYILPKQSGAGFDPFAVEIIAPEQNNPEDYTGIIKECMGSSAILSSQQNQQQSSPNQQTQQQLPQPTQQYTTTKVPRNLPKSQEEIDKVWYLKLGNITRNSNLIWNPDTKLWEDFVDTYYTFEKIPAGYSSNAITRGSSAGAPASSASSTSVSTLSNGQILTEGGVIDQPRYGYSYTHGITAKSINEAIYAHQLGRSEKQKYVGQMETGMWVDVYEQNLGECMIRMEQKYDLPVAFPMAVMLRTGAVHTTVSGPYCKNEQGEVIGTFYNIFNVKRSKATSGRQCVIPTTECYDDATILKSSVQAKINPEKGCTKVGTAAESKCESSKTGLNYCNIYDTFAGYDNPCESIESWYKLITQGSRYRECINNYRTDGNLNKLIYCVPSKGYSTSQGWYPEVRSGTISFVNNWGSS